MDKFIESVEKVSILLKDIFGDDFENKYNASVKIEKNSSFYEMNLKKDNSKILAKLVADEENNYSLELVEAMNDKIYPSNIPSDYKLAIEHTKDFLEDKYNINFLMLDPNDRDENIEEIGNDENWHVVFTHEDSSGKIKATLLLEDEKTPLISIEKKVKKQISLI